MERTPTLPQRIQRKRTKGWRMPPNTKCVTRGTRWGNPYVVGKDGTASECVAKFIKELTPYTHASGSLDDLLISTANMKEIQIDLRGKNLACFCKVGEPCHADWLLEIANGPIIE